ncbi:MAG TPA: SprT family zinc-dependent metalloprotease [Saprospiraceae bacterium]|nr:SprT family zinc-dependent metalloprotease [Saprospiraceae bacterium]
MSKILDYHLSLNEQLKVPFKVYKEKRTSWRISVTKNGAILRVPQFFNNTEIENKISWSKDWLTKQFLRKPTLQSSFSKKNFVTGDSITIIGKEYIIKVDSGLSSNRLTAKVVGSEIHIICPDLEDGIKVDAIAKLLSRLTAQIAKAYIHKRVHDINEVYFKKSITNIRFKYNSSNWGSCSSKSNINLSTRLLLAPIPVIDYVIIHELSHLVHMNHSDKFWSLVGSIMPGYKHHEKWLKVNSHLCDFRSKA